jgi:hypothetical protein
MTKRLEKAVQEDLCLALLIPGDVVLRPANKLSEFFLTRPGMVLRERLGGGRQGNVKRET